MGDSLIDCSLPRAPRRAQTGHGSLSSYNAVPQTWQARLLFVLTPLRRIGSLIDLVSHGLHKIVIGGRSEEIAEIVQTTSAKKIAQLVSVPRGNMLPIGSLAAILLLSSMAYGCELS